MNTTEINDPNAKSEHSTSEILEFEEIEFKAITEGLGFHQNRNPSTPHRIMAQGSMKKMDISARQVASVGPTIPAGPVKGELAAFYNPPAAKTVTNKQVVPTQIVLSEAKMELRFAAWLLDFIVILSSFAATIGLLYFFSGLSIAQIKSALSLNELLFYGPIIFSFFYLLYFTILDATNKGSLGKSFFGLRIILNDGHKTPNLQVSFLRALVTLSSIIFLGLPTLLDFQDHLGHSKVVTGKRA